MKKFILILLVLFIFILPVMSFAEETTILPPNDNHNYYYCFYEPAPYDTWRCVTSDSKLYKAENGFLTFKTSSFARLYTLNKSTGIWELNTSGNYSQTYQSYSLKATNIDVYYWDELIVFFSAPKVSQLLLTMKNQSPVATLKIILAGLIPLLGLVISAICFRKAWAFLHSQLQH